MFVEHAVGCRWNERSDAVEYATHALAQRRAGDIRYVMRLLNDVDDKLGKFRIAPLEAEQFVAA